MNFSSGLRTCCASPGMQARGIGFTVAVTAELFDIYDDNMNFLGVKPRSQVHRDGDWHRSFHCWVIYRDASGEDYMLVQRRAPDTDTYPDYFDLSVGGHL